MGKVIRISDEVFARLESHVKGFDTPTGVIERMIDHYEGVEHDSSEKSSRKGLAKHKDLNRKQFVQSVGATCKNWNWSWSFINEEEKFILFGAWDNLADENGLLILSEKWQTSAKGRRSPGYTQSLEHLSLVENDGYQLKVFMMSGENGGEDSARIMTIDPHILDKKLRCVGNQWFAV